MADYEFTAEDLNALGARLDALETQFSVREHALLLAIFDLAAEQVESGAEVSAFAFGAPHASFASPGLPRFSFGLTGLGADGPADGSAPPPPPPTPGPTPGGFF